MSGRLKYQTPQRRRRSSVGTGGSAGSEIVRGLLIDLVPAQDRLSECIQLQIWSIEDGEFVDKLDVDSNPILVGAINTGYTPIRGSEALPIMVRGVIQKVKVDEDLFDYLEVFWFDPAGYPGHTTTTANGKPQGPFHYSGSNAYQVDGGPCILDSFGSGP